MEHRVAVARAEQAGEARLTAVPWRDFADDGGWDALAACAAEPNPFAERWFVEPGLAAFDPHGAVRLAALHLGEQRVGVLPLARRAFYERYPLPHLTGWIHANSFCGSPLVAAGYEHAFWRELLAWADSNAGAALFFHLEQLPVQGPLYAALRDVCAIEHRPAAVVQLAERALLASDLSPQAYFEASLSGKKRKELRRQAARLAEQGTVRFERRSDGDGLARWCDAFLALEAGGWKGAEGSALASNRAKAAFFAAALAGAARQGKLERLALYLDDAPIAMLANFVTPPGAYSFKTAFDERFARFSPGVLLQRENLDLLARDDVAWCDSCAAADHPMIERIWREKRAVARVSVAIGGRARRAAAAALFRAEIRRPLEGL